MLDSLPECRTTRPVQPIHIAAATGCINRASLLLEHNEKVRLLFFQGSFEDNVRGRPRQAYRR